MNEPIRKLGGTGVGDRGQSMLEEAAEMFQRYILFLGELKCMLLAHYTYTSNFIYSHLFSKLLTFSDFGLHWPGIVNDTGYH